MGKDALGLIGWAPLGGSLKFVAYGLRLSFDDDSETSGLARDTEDLHP